MFQVFANYLLGSVTNEDQRATAEGVEYNSTRLTAVESPEEDWVLVDRDSEGNSDVSSVASLDLEDDCQGSNVPLPALLTRTSSASSLPCTSIMEESWFVTPPPCFTSAGPIHVETSPLENLLIEHPSMSVYHTHTRRHQAIRPASPREEAQEEFEVDDVDEDEVAVVNRIVAPRNNNRLQVLQQQERQGLKSKRAQKVQMQKACQVMKRGYLDRNNKAREVNSRNRRQRRGERSQGATRSYANNNRKC